MFAKTHTCFWDSWPIDWCPKNCDFSRVICSYMVRETDQYGHCMLAWGIQKKYGNCNVTLTEIWLFVIGVEITVCCKCTINLKNKLSQLLRVTTHSCCNWQLHEVMSVFLTGKDFKRRQPNPSKQIREIFPASKLSKQLQVGLYNTLCLRTGSYQIHNYNV